MAKTQERNLSEALEGERWELMLQYYRDVTTLKTVSVGGIEITRISIGNVEEQMIIFYAFKLLFQFQVYEIAIGSGHIYIL